MDDRFIWKRGDLEFEPVYSAPTDEEKQAAERSILEIITEFKRKMLRLS